MDATIVVAAISVVGVLGTGFLGVLAAALNKKNERKFNEAEKARAAAELDAAAQIAERRAISEDRDRIVKQYQDLIATLDAQLVGVRVDNDRLRDRIESLRSKIEQLEGLIREPPRTTS